MVRMNSMSISGKCLGALLAFSLLAACSSSDKDANSGITGAAGGPGSIANNGFLAPGVGDKIFFDTDSSVVRADGQGTLDAQADWLSRNPRVNVVIAGDCDERGTEEYNLALGSRRAYAAASYLAAKGVPAARISTISYGKDKPIAPGSTEDAWAQNRNAITSIR
jgi:peptidoglycan-associated lipoprotein